MVMITLMLCAHAAHSDINLDFLKPKVMEVVVDDAFAEIHTGPGRGYPVFHVIEKGEKIYLFKKHTDWYKMRTEAGLEGWIQRNELTKTLASDGSDIDFAAPDWQDYVDRRWEIGVLGGKFGKSDTFTNYLAFHLTPNIATELRYTQTFSAIANNKLLSINAIHTPFPQWKVSPFFVLGAGKIKISPSADLVQTENRDNPVLTVGGGATFYVTRRFLIRAEYNHHTLLTERESNEEVEEWKAGFSVFF